MRSNQEIREKFEDLRNRRLKERKAKFLCRSFLNCSFNRRMRVKGHGKVGFCINALILGKVRTPFCVCNSDEQAEKCACFECRNTEESVEKDFNEVLRSPSRCGDEYPKLAILLWMLQRSELPIEDEKAGTRLDRFFALCKSLFLFGWW